MEKKFISQMEPHFGEEEAAAVFEYMKSGGWVMEFKKTRELERMIAEFVGAKHCVMTTNGTISLTLAMLALGLGAGDEILVPDLTMIATPNAAKLIGARPVLVDVEEQTLCMDLEKAKKAITSKTKAMLYVSFNGRSGDMENIRRFCRNHNLFLIEDAAQALGSYHEKEHLGMFGEIGSFSFSVPKIITTGQGGALVTNDDALAEKLRRLKDFGRAGGGNDIHDDWGWNFKFTDLQAVIGIEQMKKLSQRVERKKEIWQTYQDLLSQVPGIQMVATNLKNTSPWFIEIFVEKPDALAAHLKERGIGSRRIYPAIHTQKIYQNAWDGSEFPVATKAASRGLWLPSSSQLSRDDITRVADAIQVFYS